VWKKPQFFRLHRIVVQQPQLRQSIPKEKYGICNA